MEKVSFENDRGLELVGNYWSSESNAGIVMSHGLTGDKNERGYFDKVAEELNNAGYNVLAFDFAGCGESDNEELRIDKQVNDLSVAIKYLESRGSDRVGLFGYSQGGLVSIRNYTDSIDAMVLTSPVTDSTPNYKQSVKNPQKEIIIDEEIIKQKDSIDQDELLSGVKCTTLIIHGDQDEIVPLESSRNADRKLKNSRLEIIEGLDHGYDTHLDEVTEKTVNWFEEYLPVSET